LGKCWPVFFKREQEGPKPLLVNYILKKENTDKKAQNKQEEKEKTSQSSKATFP
jgi:hypothetical protein